MLRKTFRLYIKNKLTNSIKINNVSKLLSLKSIFTSNHLTHVLRIVIDIKRALRYGSCTSINDVCLVSGTYKKASKLTNLNRYEFHKLCRNNKLSSFIVKS